MGNSVSKRIETFQFRFDGETFEVELIYRKNGYLIFRKF